MERGPKKMVGILLPMKVYEPLKAMADADGRPLSAYIRQILRRYIRYMQTHQEPPWDWWPGKK